MLQKITKETRWPSYNFLVG